MSVTWLRDLTDPDCSTVWTSQCPIWHCNNWCPCTEVDHPEYTNIHTIAAFPAVFASIYLSRWQVTILVFPFTCDLPFCKVRHFESLHVNKLTSQKQLSLMETRLRAENINLSICAWVLILFKQGFLCDTCIKWKEKVNTFEVVIIALSLYREVCQITREALLFTFITT